MKKLLFSILFLLSLPSFAIYKVGSTSKYVSNGPRNIPNNVYYPATVDGINTPIINDGSKFPVISFGHGFVMQPTAYNWLVNALVPYGYILAFPGTETGVPPSHSKFVCSTCI